MNLPANYIQAAKTAIQAQWSDTVTVYREEKVGNVKEPVVMYADVPCHLSQGTLPALSQSSNVATTVAVFTVFVDTAVQLKAGDTLVVSHKGQTFTGAAGEPLNGTFSNTVKLGAVKIT